MSEVCFAATSKSSTIFVTSDSSAALSTVRPPSLTRTSLAALPRVDRLSPNADDVPRPRARNDDAASTNTPKMPMHEDTDF